MRRENHRGFLRRLIRGIPCALLVAAWFAAMPPAGALATPRIGLVVDNPAYSVLAVDAAGTTYGLSTSTIDPTAGNRLYASSDEGRTWTAVADFPTGSRVVTISVLGDGTLIASVDQTARSLYRSDDHGHTWTKVFTFRVIGPGLVYRTLTAHSIGDDGQYVYVGSYNTLDAGSHTNYVWRSADDGRTWSLVRETTSHRHIHFVQVDPTSGDVYVGYGDSNTQALIERSPDHGATWQSVCSGVACTSVDLSFDPSGRAYFATDSPSTQSWITRLDLVNGSITQIFPIVGDSYSAFHLGNGVWIVGATHEPVGLYPSGDTTVHVYASDDDGQTWGSAFERPFQDPLGYVAAMVRFAYPDGDFPIQIAGYGTLVGRIAPRQPGNLLSDADVELEASDFFGQNGPGTFAWATDAAHGGSHSLRVVGSSSGLSRWYSQPLSPATAGHTYTASAWLKTQSSSNATVDMNFWSASGTYLGANFESAPVNGTLGWTQVSVQGLAPAGTASVREEVRLAAGGTVWADDLVLADGSVAPPAVALVIPPALSGTPVPGSPVSVTNGTWTGSPAAFGYQWQRCNPAGAACADVSGAVSSTYRVTAADLGFTLRAVVTAAGGGPAASAASAIVASGAALPFEPSIVTLPAVAGQAQAGGTLTASAGTWSGGPTAFSYQWWQCDPNGANCNAITGATTSTYVPSSSDVGQTLRTQVTATNAAGTGAATSAATAAVAGAPAGSGFTVVTDPGCGGCSVSVGSDGTVRAAIQGGADTVDTAYAVDDFGGSSGLTGTVFVRDQLGLAAGQALNGNLSVLQVRDAASALVYELYVAPDRTLRLWSPAGGLGASSLNLSTGSVVPNDGTSSIRVEVSALASGSVTVRVNGVDRITVGTLSGATSGNERFLDVGIDHYDTSTTNEPVATVHASVAESQAGWLGAPSSGPPQSTSAPAISGSAVQGQVLTSSQGSWSGSPTGYATQWQRCDASGAGCVAIAGATGSSYTVAAGDVGSTLRVQVTASNAQGSTPAQSAATAVVQPPPSPPANTTPPAITGSAVQGQVLSATQGAWTGSPTGYATQWQRCDGSGAGCAAISGATSSSYTVAAADVGSTLRVQVTATNAGGSTPASSAATAAVTVPPPPANTTPPAITGSAVQGQVLSATQGAWTGSPTGYATQWQRCDGSGAGCAAIAGATGSSYPVAAADVGSTLRVQVTATNAGGSTPASSAATVVVTAPTVVNLAPDPDFEANPSTSYYTNGSPATFTWVTDASHSPSSALKIVSTSSGLTRWMSVTTAIRAAAGKGYSASAWLKTSGASGGAMLAVDFWDASSTYLGTTVTSATVSGTQPWTQVSLHAVAPANTVYLRVEFRLNGGGTLWADDVVVSQP